MSDDSLDRFAALAARAQSALPPVDPSVAETVMRRLRAEQAADEAPLWYFAGFSVVAALLVLVFDSSALLSAGESFSNDLAYYAGWMMI